MTITFVARLAAATALLVALPAGAAVGGGGHHSADPEVLASGLAGPLHLAAAPRGGVAVSQSFSGDITLVSRGSTSTLYSAPNWDVAGLDYSGTTLYFVQSQGAGPEDDRALLGAIRAIDADGTVRTITSGLAALETADNPDGDAQYGLAPDVAAANPACVEQLAGIGAPSSYGGEVDSHVYGLAVNGRWAFIADAGANTVIAVNLRTRAAHTVAVLPPQPVTLTADQAAALGAPDCAGLTYAFEPVPTDVAIGKDGAVYVSTLPGGPESPALGARGAVYRIDKHGTARPYVTGLVSPTGIAFDQRGTLYVASLFGDGVLSVHRSHGPTVVLAASLVADVAVDGRWLYATTDALGSGTVVKVRR